MAKKKEQYKGTDKTVLITQVVSLTLLSEGMCSGMRWWCWVFRTGQSWQAIFHRRLWKITLLSCLRNAGLCKHSGHESSNRAQKSDNIRLKTHKHMFSHVHKSVQMLTWVFTWQS